MSSAKGPAPAGNAPSVLSRFFTQVIRWRWLVIALYAAILPPAAYYAAQVNQDNSIDRLIIPTDPDYIDNEKFRGVFGGGEYAVLIAEAPDPFTPAVLARLDQIETALSKVPKVTVNSAISVYRRAKGGFSPTPETAAAFRAFVTGTDLIQKQGLSGDKFLAMAVILDIHDRDERSEILRAIDRAVDEGGGGGPPLTALRKVGQPYVNVHLDEGTRRLGPILMGLFAVIVVLLNLSLYRSVRTLLAFLITLGVTLALSVGYIGVTGGMFTVVTPMVPMTILITTTSSLVYIHSRFVDRPAGSSVEDHHIFALTNKFVAVTASIFATLVGFGALAVSEIAPIRQMGIWVAVGLLFAFVVVFTLFPALVRVLAAPTGQEKQAAGQWFMRLTEWLPRASYRFRYPLVIGSLVLSALGAVALFGFGKVVAPMRMIANPTDYISTRSALYADTKRIEEILPGLSITEVWLQGPSGKEGFGLISEPEVLTGLHRFQQTLEADPEVGSAVGPTTVLRMIRYLSGQGDAWPNDAEGVDALAATLEGLMPNEPLIQRFVKAHSLSETHVVVLSRATEYDAFKHLDEKIKAHWDATVAANPALKPLAMKTVGLGRLQAKMSQNLVPTLVESFGLTVVIIFGTFLLVFRSGAARLMAMIPSLFAILVMFGVMRVSGMSLNIATILIASTVLGTSENDQIHFFYHFLEKRKEGTVEEALRHTLQVSGKAIFFATLINACGFISFAFAELPPMRQFGILSALALVLSMVADFTALPAALWIIFREKPDARPGEG